MKVYLTSLGCRLNEAELETWSQVLFRTGHQPILNPLEADLIIFNSCAVTTEAVKKSRKKCRRLKRDNPQAKLVVSGCYATLNPAQIKMELDVDLVVENQAKEQLIETVFKTLTFNETTDLIQQQPIQRSRQRAFIKIQDGCRYRCSYCIVTLARGEEKSRPIQYIIAEINLLVAQGIQEVVLTGVHIGGYGSDLKIRLSHLIQAIFDKTELKRLRIGSIEPWEMEDDFWACFQNPRLMPHLHLPLQSGSDSVLRRMSRRCHTTDFYQLLTRARAMIEHFSITTDIIVGFPNESEAEWQESLAFIQQCQFSDIHIFAFSAREGTKAAKMPHQISLDIKKQRSQVLHTLTQDMRQRFLNQQKQQIVDVLIEQIGANGYWQGYSPNYTLLEVMDLNPAVDFKNTIQKVKITGLNQNNVVGKLY